jgi:hypothetical protein
MTTLDARSQTTTLEDFPRYPLTLGPSPVHRLDRLTTHLDGAAVWAKREDVNSGLAFGGNKTRKLNTWSPTRWRKGATHSSRSVACSRTTRVRSRRRLRSLASDVCSCRRAGSTGPT